MSISHKEKLAYFAGFIDGEGSLSIIRQVRKEALSGFRYYPDFDIANTNLSSLTWIQQQFGGRFSHEERNNRYKILYRLHFVQRKMRELLPQLIPYLIIKRRQAELILKFLELNEGKNSYSFNKDNFKHRFWAECCQLNNRKYKNSIPIFLGLRNKVTKALRTCSQGNCDNKHYAKGLCKKHYRKLIEYPSSKLKREGEIR